MARAEFVPRRRGRRRVSKTARNFFRKMMEIRDGEKKQKQSFGIDPLYNLA
jgi:hypothetical protein